MELRERGGGGQFHPSPPKKNRQKGLFLPAVSFLVTKIPEVGCGDRGFRIYLHHQFTQEEGNGMLLQKEETTLVDKSVLNQDPRVTNKEPVEMTT